MANKRLVIGGAK
jgi:hypothetical protein